MLVGGAMIAPVKISSSPKLNLIPPQTPFLSPQGVVANLELILSSPNSHILELQHPKHSPNLPPSKIPVHESRLQLVAVPGDSQTVELRWDLTSSSVNSFWGSDKLHLVPIAQFDVSPQQPHCSCVCTPMLNASEVID